MKVKITEKAHEKLNHIINETGAIILFYDTEGCGCAVNGIPQLLIISLQSVSNLQKIQSNTIPFYMYKNQMIFFDEELIIDSLNNKLKLYSNNQIFSNHMSVKRLEHPL